MCILVFMCVSVHKCEFVDLRNSRTSTCIFWLKFKGDDLTKLSIFFSTFLMDQSLLNGSYIHNVVSFSQVAAPYVSSFASVDVKLICWFHIGLLSFMLLAATVKKHS